MNLEVWYLLVTVAACAAEGWAWPKSTASVRIDTKVKFLDGDFHDGNFNKGRLKDEPPFQEATETEGFYNRPANSGRYNVRVENPPSSQRLNYQGQNQNTQCRCEPTSACNPHNDVNNVCGPNKYLCCYNRGNLNHPPSEVFNEIEDERPMLLPGQERLARPFPPPPNTELNGSFDPGHAHEAAVLGSLDRNLRFGTEDADGPDLLVGPAGPTGMIGPHNKNKEAILVGPSGPTGIIGPDHKNLEPQRLKDIRPSESAQRGVLVGPQGPTGIIGPNFRRQPVLVGPGGPTGIIGPRGFRRPSGPGVLVGPGGPTGIIGPGRQLLVGPGGPTGIIGPQGYFGK